MRLKGRDEVEDLILKKTMKNNGVILVKKVDRETAKKIIVDNHYSKKWNDGGFGKYNFGIYKENEPNACLGVAVFGNLLNPKSYKSINTDIEMENIVELNRLWISDELGYNTETVFLSLCFKYFKLYESQIKMVQSFADGRLGCGTIYKASNFKYYGCHETLFYEDIRTLETHHHTPFENTNRPSKMIGSNIGYIRNFFLPFKVKTFRYIYYIDKKIEKNTILKEEKYPEYSKGVEYIELKPKINVIARCFLICQKLECEDISKEFYMYLKSNFEDDEIKIAIRKAEENIHIKKFFNKNNDESKQHLLQRIYDYDKMYSEKE